MAAARSPGRATARIHPRGYDQDPDAVSSRIRPGAAATGGPRHQCGAASLASRAPERDPGRATSSGFIAGCGRYASGLGGMAGGTDEALHLASEPATRAAVAGVGQSGWPQDARPGAVVVPTWGHAALHTGGRRTASA